jgi:pyrroloquinoline quinone biosynthesis protein D
MNEYKPLRKSNLILKDMGDEFLIYSAEHKELHVINPTAQRIWELCDGKHSLQTIEDELRAHFSIPPATDIAGDILKTVNIFKDKGLLINETSSE